MQTFRSSKKTIVERNAAMCFDYLLLQRQLVFNKFIHVVDVDAAVDVDVVDVDAAVDVDVVDVDVKAVVTLMLRSHVRPSKLRMSFFASSSKKSNLCLMMMVIETE